MPLKFTCFFSILFFLVSNSLFGQYWDYSYTHFEKKDGLPSNTVYFITSDNLGNLWIGTDAGLCKFDGNRFQTFTTEDGLPSNEVYEIFCDRENRIWTITMGNKITFVLKDKVHDNSTNPELKNIQIPDRISRIIENESEEIWVFSYPFTISRLSKTNQIRNQSYYFGQQICNKIIKINKGLLVVTNKNSLFFGYKDSQFHPINALKRLEVNDIISLNDSTFLFSDKQNNLKRIKFNFKELSLSSNSHVLTIFKIDSLIWQLKNDGIACYKINLLNSSKKYLKDLPVSNYHNDIYGNNWVSTLNNGLFKLNSLDIINYKPSMNNTSNSIYSLLVNKDEILLGRNNGSISIINKKNKSQNISLKLEGNSVLSFRVLKIIQKNGLYILCTDIGIFSVSEKTHLVKNLGLPGAFKNIYIDSNKLLALDNIQVISYTNDFDTIKLFRNYDRFYSHTIYLNKKLFGSENALYYEDDSLKKYTLDQPFNYRLMDMKTQDSLLVIATAEKGVFFIKDHHILGNLNLQNGLNSNSTAKIIPYKTEWIIATNNGIARFDMKTGNIDKIMESDGLASNNVLDIAIDSDTLYAGTDNGLSVIPISSLKPRKSFAFFLNPICVNKDTIWNIIDTIKSRTGYPIFASMNAISLGVKGDVTYYYRVKERDTNFYSTSDPKIHLVFSKTGNYTLEAFSIDVNNVKSTHAILTILVVPYWYQTQLFKWACFFAFILCLYFVIRALTIYIRKREQIKIAVQNKITKLELDVWKSNINPHFLYNSLNIIQSLFLNNKFEDANKYVGSFTSVLRNTIDNSENLMIRIETEVKYLSDYLDLECMKRSGRLSFNIIVEPEVETNYWIPSLVLQPIIENSIKHGLKHHPTCHIIIRIAIAENSVLATVADNGPGLPSQNIDFTKSKGLRLVQDKIRLVENITMKKNEFHMENIYSDDNKCLGVISTFLFPIISKQEFEIN